MTIAQRAEVHVEGATIHQVGPFRMFLLDDDVGISATLRLPNGFAQREPAFMSILRESARERPLSVDIGANLGWATLALCAASSPDGQVIAIEPVARNVTALRANLVLNGFAARVRVHRAAVGERATEATFRLAQASNLGGLDPTTNTGAGTETVRVAPISAFLKEGERPSLYKMDVEGREWAVLAGMRQTLRAAPIGARLLIEVHPELYANYGSPNPMERELRALIEAGYVFRYIVSAGVAQPDVFAERGLKPVRVFPTFQFTRGLYECVPTEDAITLSTSAIEQPVPNTGLVSPRVVRSITLERIAAG